jgi:hypothetical protein
MEKIGANFFLLVIIRVEYYYIEYCIVMFEKDLFIEQERLGLS